MLGWHVSVSSLSFLGSGGDDDAAIVVAASSTSLLTRSKEGMLRLGIRIVVTGDGNDNNDAINGGGADINDGESVSERPLMMMMMVANVVSLL